RYPSVHLLLTPIPIMMLVLVLIKGTNIPIIERKDRDTNLHGYRPPLRFHSISTRSSFAFSPPLPCRFPRCSRNSCAYPIHCRSEV
ncbi:hypothetical protein BJV78DRAFT_1246404, partial [Lactifluus subvellereus]